MVAAAASRTPWLFGRASDLLLGCGISYLLLFLAIAAVGAPFMAAAPKYLITISLLFTSVPHLGATLVRVYERREDRERYRLFTVWGALGVWLAFVISVYDVTFGSWFLTIYLTWSPWHFSGQNYGIALMLLGRRGAAVPPLAKRLLQVSFVLSFALVFLGIHSVAGSVSYSPVPVSADASVYLFIPLGIPLEVVGTGMLLVGAAYAACLVAVPWLLVRSGARAGDLGVLLAVLALQAIWFSLPVLCRTSATFQDILPLSASVPEQDYLLLWIGVAHSVQYLWVTTFYSQSARTDKRYLPYWTKTYLAGAACFGIPVFLFSPDLLGVYAFDDGLGLLVASAVNIHHFILDGAIWKLRDGRIARVLLRPVREAALELQRPPGGWRRSLGLGALAVVGVAYGLFTIVGNVELEHGFRRALGRSDVERMRTAARRMSWVGRNSFALYYDLGVIALRNGDLETARREVERSLELAPKAEAWVTLGRIHARQGSWQEAVDSYDRALAIDPANVLALRYSARAWLRLGRPDAARDALSRAVSIAPERKDLRDQLDRLRGSSGRAGES